jgi:Mg2+-importing ATPase
VPFFRSRPSATLSIAALSVVATGAALPYTALAAPLGFSRLPIAFLLTVLGLIVAYLLLIELAKHTFFTRPPHRFARARWRAQQHRIQRRASRFTHRGPLH